jgi:hypothetical protein
METSGHFEHDAAPTPSIPSSTLGTSLFNALWMGSEPALTMQSESVWFLALLIAMNIQILIGNLLLLHTVFSGRLFGNKATTSLVVSSLASADLLIGLLVLPYYIFCVQLLGLRDQTSWHYRLWSVLDSSLTTASIYSLALVTLDRLLAIRYPLHYTRRVRRSHLRMAIACIWLLGIGCSSIGQTLVGRPRWLQLFGTILTFYLPFALILTSNCYTFVCIRRRMRRRCLPVKPICAAIIPVMSCWQLTGEVRSAQSTICSQSSASTYLQASRRSSLCSCAASRSPDAPCTCSTSIDPPPPRRPAWLQAITKPKLCRVSSPLAPLTPLSVSLACASSSVTVPAISSSSSASHSATNPTHLNSHSFIASLPPLPTSAQQIGSRLSRHYTLVFREFKLIKLLGTINLCFIVCWLPYYIHSELVRFEIVSFDRQLTVYLLTLGWFNSGIDPIIYLYLSNKFRKQMRKTFCCLA